MAELIEERTRTPGEVVVERSSPVYQAFRLLHVAFIAAPTLAGLDKFAHVLVNWDLYLAPAIARILPFSPHTFMLIVGVIEIIAGLIVAARPQVGAYIVAAWLCGIIINLLISGHYFDIALRDFGLMLCALALGRLALAHSPRPIRA